MGNLKVYIIVGLIILAVLVTIYLIGRHKGKQYTPKNVALPPDTQSTVVNTSWNPGSITDAIYADLDASFFHSEQPYKDALELSNSQIVAVHNDWNKRYFSKDKMTLRQAVDDDFNALNPLSSYNALTNAFSARLKTLGL